MGPVKIVATAPDFSGSTDYEIDLGDLIEKRLNRLLATEQIVNEIRQPTAKFQRDYESNVIQIETAIRALARGQIDLRSIVDILLSTQEAARAANKAAEGAQAQVAKQADYTRVRDSYSDTGVLTASNAAGVVTISVAAHQRHYLDPQTDVALNAGTISDLPAATQLFVFYDDEAMTGGAVTYQAVQDQAIAVATLSNPYRHAVGSLLTPTSTGEDSTGLPSLPPWKQAQERNNEQISA